MRSTLVYTANIGGRDVIHGQAPQRSHGPIDFLYVTDGVEDGPAPWRTLHVPRDASVHPNMQAKWWRTHPPFDGIIGGLTPNAPYDHCVWIDAGMELVNPTAVYMAVQACPPGGLAAWVHPRRDCIHDEVEASLGAEAQGGRYDHLPLREQAAAYEAEGFPRHWGLFATGTLVWTRDSAEMIGDEWLAECEKWGYQDQISLPVVCWRHGLRPGVFPIPQTGRFVRRGHGWWSNGWMRLHNHVPGTGGA